MGDSRDKIKDIFSAKLKDFEADVPAGLWVEIEKDLPAKKIILPKRILLKVGSIAASVVFVAAMSVYVYNTSLSDDREEDNHVNIPKAKHAITVQDTVPEMAVETPKPVVKKKRIPKPVVVEPEPEIVDDPPAPIEKPPRKSFYKKSTSEAEITNRKITMEKMDPNGNAIEKKKRKKSFYTKSPDDEDTIEKKNKKNKSEEKKKGESLDPGLSIGVDGSGLFAFNKSTDNLSVLNKWSFETNKFEDRKLKHDQPISFGINISKRLSPRLSIQTGLVYTYLKSKEYSVGSSEVELDNTQKFHYLGIPLLVNYDIAQWKKARFYISAGGMIQKDIWGRYMQRRALTFLDGSDVYIKESIHQKHPQFSVLSTVGVSYPIYNKLSIYTTVGGAYYFDANNKYQTIYSDKKFQLDLNVGLKFDF